MEIKVRKQLREGPCSLGLKALLTPSEGSGSLRITRFLIDQIRLKASIDLYE